MVVGLGWRIIGVVFCQDSERESRSRSCLKSTNGVINSPIGIPQGRVHQVKPRITNGAVRPFEIIEKGKSSVEVLQMKGYVG